MRTRSLRRQTLDHRDGCQKVCGECVATIQVRKRARPNARNPRSKNRKVNQSSLHSPWHRAMMRNAVELPTLIIKNLGRWSASSGMDAVQFVLEPKKIRTNENGRRAMARMNFGSLPRENPCAQCGQPISVPEWIEKQPGRTSYLWHCLACDYRFEAVAFFEDSEVESEPLAA